MTMREVEDALGNMNARLDSFNPLINAIVGELDKLYGITFTWLDESGKLNKLPCGGCGREIYTPVLEGMTPPDSCPYCEKSLGEEE